MNTRQPYKSTNPFDDSFDENHADEGDESSQYEDCISESTSLLPKTATQHHDITVDSAIPKDENPLINHSYHNEDRFKKKRVAPLNFDQVDVEAKPALTFDGTNNHDNTFLSPLESIFMSPSNLLSDHEEDEDDYDNHNDSENDETAIQSNSPMSDYNDSYFSFNYWSSMAPSPSRLLQSSKEMIFGGTELPSASTSDALHVSTSKSSESFSFHSADDEVSNVSTNDNFCSLANDDGVKRGQHEDKDVVANIPPSIPTDETPLKEAKDVLSRMDSVVNSISSSIVKNERKISFRTSNTTSKRPKKKKASSKMPTVNRASKILHQVENNIKDTDLTMDHRHPGKPWSRMIILEELGTASSWIVLLLPYIAFMIALFLDSDSSQWNSVTSPSPTAAECVVNEIEKVSDDGTINSFPLIPCPARPCYYPYEPSKDVHMISMVERNVESYDTEYVDVLSGGVVVTSGPIIGVPVISTYLFGDVKFTGLSNESVSLVRSGSVYYSTVVLQQEGGKNVSADTGWYPMSISKPTRLDLVCSNDGSSWICRSPRIVDILFSLPDTSFFTGGALRVETILSYNEYGVDSNCKKHRIQFPMNDDGGNCTGSTPTVSNVDSANDSKDKGNVLISELAMSARYTISHRRPLYSDLAISVRVTSILISTSFFIFWFWRMGLKGFFGIDNGNCWMRCLFRLSPQYEQQEASRRGQEISWWESPWFVFPERRYLFFLLIALLMVQNPILVYMYFQPKLYSSAFLRFLVDTLIGVGIHIVLALWLCLFQGLRYHTSKIALKRAEHQREALELQKAAKYLASSGNIDYKYYENTSDNARSYYEQYGDLYGKGFEINNLRLKHDPCGTSFPDFILPKVLLLLIGVISVVSTTYARYPGSFSTDIMFHGALDRNALQYYRSIYVVGSLIQVVVLGSWILLIIKSGMHTGSRLKSQNFLATRPSQLAFRVLASIMLGGIGSAVIPSLSNFFLLLNKWMIHEQGSLHDHSSQSNAFIYTTSRDPHGDSDILTFIDLLFKVIARCTEKFPYSGTAAGLGPGKIMYITVCTLVVAFIFLPSRNVHDQETESNDDDAHENQRRDKRMVITLAKYTHTWRVFPLPIQKMRFGVTQIRQNGCFQIDRKFRLLSSSFGRGAIYKSNYVPVFCIEIALWLLECSWQAYYSATEYMTDDWAPGRMNLDSLGLNLEADITNEDVEIQAFVASNIGPQIDGEADSVIVVGFRGTASTANIMTDLNFKQVPLPAMFQSGLYDRPEIQINIQTPSDIESEDFHVSVVYHEAEKVDSTNFSSDLLKRTPLARQALPLIHQGFLQVYLPVRDELINSVVKLMKRQLTKSIIRQQKSSGQVCTLPLVLPKIYITGHSLGGALGQLLALDIANNVEITYLPPVHGHAAPKRLQPPVAVYSFGQPRVGNRAFARLYKKFVCHTFRVANEGDAISSLPFAAICGLYKLYKHAGLEVMLDETSTGNTLVGPTVVETLFRFSKVRTKMSAHFVESYRCSLEGALTQDELQEFYCGRGGERVVSNGHDLPDWVTQKGRSR